MSTSSQELLRDITSDKIHLSPHGIDKCVVCGEWNNTVHVKCVVEFNLCTKCATKLCDGIHEVLLYDWEHKKLKV